MMVKDSHGVEYVGLGKFYEELPLGYTFRTVGRTITEADLVAFVNATGFTEVLFTNVEFLKEASDIQGRVLPGALVYSMAEGLLMQAAMQHTGFAFLEMDLKVHKPTFAQDTIYVQCEVTEARTSASRTDRGLVRTANRIINQHGETVITYNPLRYVARAPA